MDGLGGVSARDAVPPPPNAPPGRTRKPTQTRKETYAPRARTLSNQGRGRGAEGSLMPPGTMIVTFRGYFFSKQRCTSDSVAGR